MTVYKALGTIFKWYDGAALTAISQCKSVDGPDESIDAVDTSNMDTTGGKRTYQPTLVNGGQIKLEIKYDPDDVMHKKLIADAEAMTARAFELSETDAAPVAKTAGTGIITALGWKRDFADVLLMSVTIQVSGALTHA